MEIVHLNGTPGALFEDLDPEDGDPIVFTLQEDSGFEGRFFVKTSVALQIHEDQPPCNAVDLQTGELLHVAAHVPVIRLAMQVFPTGE